MKEIEWGGQKHIHVWTWIQIRKINGSIEETENWFNHYNSLFWVIENEYRHLTPPPIWSTNSRATITTKCKELWIDSKEEKSFVCKYCLCVFVNFYTASNHGIALIQALTKQIASFSGYYLGVCSTYSKFGTSIKINESKTQHFNQKLKWMT